MNTIRAQIEAEYQAAQDALAAKFKPLLDAVAAFDRETAPTKRARKRKVATENNADNDTILPPPNTEPTEEDGWKNSEAFHDACIQVRQVLIPAGTEGLAMKAIVEQTQLAESVVRDVVSHMVENGTVNRFGQKRGTRYAVAVA